MKDRAGRAALQKYVYLAANMLISVLSLLRNLFFMKTLVLTDLAQVALVQTLVMLIGFVQFGIVNGAYIQYARDDGERKRRTVDTFFTLAALLTAAAGIFVLSNGSSSFGASIPSQTITFGLFTGLATLLSTWLNNSLIADGRLPRSNLVNLMAVGLSLATGVASIRFGLTAALWSLLLQPVIAVLAIVVLDPNLRPRRPRLDAPLLRELLQLGFVPFAGGLFVLGAQQMERWAITFGLGAEALGQFYIVIIYTTVFSLIPVSLLNVFLPRSIRAYDAGDHTEFRAIARQHAIDLVSYLVLTTMATVVLLPWTVETLLPRFVGSERLVWFLLPAQIIFVVRDIATLHFYSKRSMRPLLVTGAASLVLEAALIAAVALFDVLSLETVILARALAYFGGIVPLLWGYNRSVGDLRT